MTQNGNKQGRLSTRMLTVSEVADILHVHPNTVRTWSNDGLLKAYRVGYRKSRRYKIEDIESFLDAKHNDGRPTK